MLGSLDCPHGCSSVESVIHLFWNFQVARALRFASLWSKRWEFIQSEDIFDYLNCLMNLDKTLPALASDKNFFFLFASLILDHI